MYKYCNSLNCLSIAITVLNNKVNVESNIDGTLNIKVSKDKNIFIKGYKLNKGIDVLSYILNKNLNINCDVICDVNDGYTHLVCKSGIVHTKNNKPIYILI